MTQARRLPPTYADIEALPTGWTGQIIGGQLYAFPRPRSRHAKAQGNLHLLLGGFHDETRGPDDPGGWVLRAEFELHLENEILVPDLAGWHSERATWPEDAAYTDIVPDWICEVLSPSTETLDRAEKMPAYAHHGVRHAWLVDPDARVLEVYELSAGVLRQRGPAYHDRVTVNAPPFEARGIEMWRVWG